MCDNCKKRVRTRVAPSPTGDPHVGTAYIALFNIAFAHVNGGDFILRIEDTDRNRYTAGSEQMIFDALKWLDLNYSEGPDVGGDYGPYRQSERFDLYGKYAKELVEKGGAYYCFCDHERLENLRERQKAMGLPPGYDGHCRSLSKEEIEEKLNEYGINVVKSDYDMTEQQFQEDEEKIYEMIKEKYHENGYELLPEKEQTVRTDIRSIVMIYRKRRGSVSTTIGKSRHIMLTSNSTIANVSKRYESNQSTNSGHIPACISVDIFGAVLWLNQPMKMVKYQKNRLLADCYDFLNPSQELLELYIKSLDDARKSENIDEKKFLFLRSHPVVRESLMNITRGIMLVLIQTLIKRSMKI